MNPDPMPGVSWRPLARRDLDALAALHLEWERDYAIPYRTSRDELEHRMEDPNLDLGRDTRVAVDDDGRIVACCFVFIGARSKVKHRAILVTLALRSHARLERPAIRWGEAVARRRFAVWDDRLPRVVRGFAEVHEADRISAYEAEGFEIARYFLDMIRPLDRPIPEAVVPAGVELRPWRDRWVESSHEAHAEAFADHWGSLPPTLDEWRHWMNAPNLRADLSFVAVAGAEVVAYCLSGIYPDDFETRGRREGWIDTLGTRRAWRKKGLASALIVRSMHAFAAEGLDHAALGVDSANPTGAFGLYERLGFTEVSRSLALVKELGT